MQWVLVHLTAWALKTKSTKDLKKALYNYKEYRGLDSYYPVHEDVRYGKKDTGFGEYFFVEYRKGIDYSILEESEDFDKVLVTAEDNPHLLSDEEVQQISSDCVITHPICPGDQVLILHGGYRGNKGIVESYDGNYCELTVMLANEIHHLAVSGSWVKPFSKNQEKEDDKETAYELPV